MTSEDFKAVSSFLGAAFTVLCAAVLIAGTLTSAPWLWFLHDQSEYCQYAGTISRLYTDEINVRRSARYFLFGRAKLYRPIVSYSYERDSHKLFGNTYWRPDFATFDTAPEADAFLKAHFKEGQPILVSARCDDASEDTFVEFAPEESMRILTRTWLVFFPLLVFSFIVSRFASSAKRISPASKL